jgi:hypothetical protein
MPEHLGYVVLEYRQTGGTAYLVSDLYDDSEPAAKQVEDMAASAAAVGRRDRFLVAAVTELEGDDA